MHFVTEIYSCIYSTVGLLKRYAETVGICSAVENHSYVLTIIPR